MDLNKWKRFKRSGSYRKRVSKKCLEMKSALGSEFKSITSTNKRESSEVCDGSVQYEMEIGNYEAHLSECSYNQED